MFAWVDDDFSAGCGWLFCAAVSDHAGCCIWLARHLGELPIEVMPDRIVADRTYLGTGLSLITAIPNPDDPKLGVLIYTAQRSQDIAGINAVRHGPTDWVIGIGELRKMQILRKA